MPDPKPPHLPPRPTREEWRRYFSHFDRVVLYANASGKKVAAPPAGALAIVFNRFVVPGLELGDTPTLLVARNGAKGIGLVYRDVLEDVLAKFGEDGPNHVVRMTTITHRRDTGAHELSVPYVDLDLRGYFDEVYPSGVVPSTGYAMATWLVDLGLPCPIELRGFTGVRSETNKISYQHDWTFERASLRLHAERGTLLGMQGASGTLAALRHAHPGVGDGTLRDAYVLAIQERIAGNEFIQDRLMSATRLTRWIAKLRRDLKGKR